MAWNSLVKEESLGCQITSPFNKKFGCFVRNSFFILFYETTQFPLYRKTSMYMVLAGVYKQ